jgi:hypothetical protein
VPLWLGWRLVAATERPAQKRVGLAPVRGTGIGAPFLGHAVAVDPDLASLVESAFGKDADAALAALLTLGERPEDREPDRVRRAVLMLSQGDLGRLRHFVDRAHQDYRDVLMWAEYPPPSSDEPLSYADLRRSIGLPPDPEHPTD